jgi:hypothetical protein
MRILTLEISSNLIEEGFATGNVVKHTVITKGLPTDAKLMGAGLNNYGNLELRFESEKQEGDEKHICVECTTLADA